MAKRNNWFVYIPILGVTLWNLLWCIGLIDLKFLIEVDDIYMPHIGTLADDKDDYNDRFASHPNQLLFFLYHGDYTGAGLYQHSLDIKNALEKAEVNWDGSAWKYNNATGKLFPQTMGQPLRFTKFDCFQEGALDFHTVLPGPMDSLIAAAQGIAAVAAPLDTNPSSFIGPWLNPYSFCLWADLFKLLQPTVFGPTLKIFGHCRKFLNPNPEDTFPVLQAAYDWVNFMFFDIGYAAQSKISPCSVHTSFVGGLEGMNPTYNDCTASRTYYNSLNVAQRNAAVNQGLISQELTPPEYWQLNDRVASDEEIVDIIESQCYMWDGGPFGATNALPPVPNGITNRKKGIISLYFTSHKEYFCESLKGSEKWNCWNKLWEFGDDISKFCSVHDSNAMSQYINESDAVKCYKVGTWVVISGILIIIVYVVVMGFYNMQPGLYALGVFSLLIAAVASIGFTSTLGIGATPPVALIFPLLTLGIGLDDTFVLISTKNINLKQAIISVTTTSSINFIVGCLGYTSPIPYIANFSLYFGIGSFFNWLTNLFGISFLVILWNPKPKQKQSSNDDLNKKDKPIFVDKQKYRYHSYLIIMISVLVVVVLVAVPFQKIEQDMGIHMLYKKGGTAWDFFKEFRKAGEIYNVDLITKETDFAHRQADWPIFIENISQTRYSEDISYTWMELFWMWGNPVTDNTKPNYNTRCSPTDFNSMGKCGPMLTWNDDNVPVLKNTEVHPNFVGFSSCIVLPEAYWICDGVMGNCDFGDNSGPNTAGEFRYHPDKFDFCVGKWVDLDNLWLTAQAAFQCVDASGVHISCDSLPQGLGLRILKGGRINSSKTTLFLKDLDKIIRDWIRYIVEVRKIRNDSPFDTYLYGNYHNVFSAFEGIWREFYTNFGISISAVFFVMTVSLSIQHYNGLCDWQIIMAMHTAMLTCICITMALFCTIAMLGVFDLPMMPPTIVIVILTMGISVEVMGHIAQEFVMLKGNRFSRAWTALKRLWWPLGNGVFTTVMACCCLFFVKWYLISDLMGSVILTSLFFTLFFGMITFPGVLSIVGYKSSTPIENRRVSEFIEDGDLVLEKNEKIDGKGKGLRRRNTGSIGSDEKIDGKGEGLRRRNTGSIGSEVVDLQVK